MDTFVLFLVTVVAWFALEFWRILRGDTSISQQIWELQKRWPTLGMLSGLVTGILLAHFFFGQN